MVKIAVIGICGNSVFMNVDHFHAPGETVVAHSTFEEIGGKGINQAIAAARMGADVHFLAAVGDDADAQKCADAIRAESIHGHLVTKRGKKTTFAFILTDKNGENRVTGYHGAALTEADVAAFAPQIAQSDLLLLQQEVPESVNLAAAKLAEKHGVKVILNPAPIRPMDPALAEKIWLVTPNEHEAEGLSGLDFPNCVTTLGSKGCRTPDGRIIPAIPVQPVDTTGAGDTFNGTLAVCLAEGMDMETACHYAVAASGISTTKHGVLSSIPYRNEVIL